MRSFHLNEEEIELVSAFRVLTTFQRLLLVETMLEIVKKQNLLGENDGRGNVIPLYPRPRG